MRIWHCLPLSSRSDWSALDLDFLMKNYEHQKACWDPIAGKSVYLGTATVPCFQDGPSSHVVLHEQATTCWNTQRTSVVDVLHERALRSPIPLTFWQDGWILTVYSGGRFALALGRDLVAIATCRPFPTSSCSQIPEAGSR